MKNQKSKIKNQISIICILGLIMFVASCTSTTKEEKPLETVKVTIGNIMAQIPSSGQVMPRNRLEIKPPISGRIDRVLVAEGQHVGKGQIIAWMSSNDRAALLDAARSKGEAEYKKWEDVYKPAPIVAPLNGFIIKRGVEPGQSVTTGDSILVMADQLIVKAQVDETDLGKIQIGQKAEIILDAYPEQKISAMVEHIAYESELISNVNVYEVDVAPQAVPAFFRAGMSATVNFVMQEKMNVMLLPLRAIKRAGNNTFIFIKEGQDDTVKAQKIETGLEDTSNIEIISGLNAGDEVIIPTAKMAEELNSDGRRRGPMNPFQQGSR
ncbi:MAG: HlyD family efflux transporter periplasmic adaptor subunit [bacterium]